MVLCVSLAVLVLFVGGMNGVTAEPAADEAALARHFVERGGVTDGICSVLGCGDGKLALEIVRSSNFLVHAQDPVTAAVTTAQKTVDVDGLYVKRVVVEQGPLNKLPYADNTVDLVIATSLTGSGMADILSSRSTSDHALLELSLPEILRVLRPGGKAILGRCKSSGSKNGLAKQQLEAWLRKSGAEKSAVAEDSFGIWAEITKPHPAGLDSWSHWEHGPDNNPASTDTVIKAPYRSQWFAKPYYIAMPAITTAAGGRVFTAMGHIAHHVREEAWLNTLLARNGYNGAVLWSRKLPDGYLVHRSAFIATDDVFYMIDADGCLMLDPETGKSLGRISVPEISGEWKWIALQDGVLYVLAGGEKDRPETTVVRSPRAHWSWFELSNGYYEKRVPWGFGTTVGAYDVKQKRTLWHHAEEKPVDSRAMVMGGGKVFLYCPDAHTRCLDASSGTVLWTNADKKVLDLIEQPGQGLSSTPGFKTTCFSLYTPEGICFAPQTNMNVVAISNKDGSLMWSRKKTTSNPNLLYADGHILVGIGPEGNTLVLDPLTGTTIEDLKFKKRSCARLTATPDSFFCRGWFEGITRYDRNQKKIFFDGSMRPACNDGVVPANGLLYIGPWLCDCNLSIMGTVAMCSAGNFNVETEDPIETRLETEGDAAASSLLSTTNKDWTTYRGNNAHSACSSATVPADPKLLWTFQPETAIASSAPTAAGGLIFSCGDDGKVRAIDANTGAPQWSFTTSGPIMRPPTIWNGRAYVGSGDGYVYALEACSGKLLWRFRAAPVERRIMLYDALCSSWPVNTGVLVDDGTAYAAAGIIDYDGTYVYALDALTGKVKWRNNTSGHLDKALRKGVSAQGGLIVMKDRLWMPGGNVISPAAYDLKTGECVTRAVGDGSAKANRGEEIGILNDDLMIYGGRLEYSALEDVVNPEMFFVSKVESEGLKHSILLSVGMIPPAWSSESIVFANGPKTVPVCVDFAAFEEHVTKYGSKNLPEQFRSLAALKKRWVANALEKNDTVSFAIAANAVIAVHETPQPGSRFSRWGVSALDPKNGTVIWKRDVPSAALPGGLLIDRDGRVIVTLQNGGIACLGKPSETSRAGGVL